MTIEEKKAALLAAEYGLRLQVRASYITLPFDENVDIGAVVIQSYDNDTDSLIEYAYQHLAKERQHAALLELVGELLEVGVECWAAHDAPIYDTICDLQESANRIIEDGE